MLIPAFLLMFLIIKKKGSLNKYFSNNALEKLSVSNQYFSNKARNITLFLSLLLMIIALSRPVIDEKTHTSKQELIPLVIAIDVSKSMLATDIHPNRLTFAKKKLLDIINNSKNTAISVILFAKNSFILSPLTQDFASLKILIENLDTGLNFDNGTNIYSTLEASNKLLKDYNQKNLLILSDGGDKKDFEDEIKYAKKNNIDIYTIAISTKKGAPIKLKNGNFLTNKNGDIVSVKLNEKIKDLSLKTNGGFINFTLNNSDINEILKDLTSKSKKSEFNKKSFKTYTELFYYPLALAILLLLISFSSLPNINRKTKRSLGFILFILSFNIFHIEANASIMDFNLIEKANNDYKKENYKEASKSYESIGNSTAQKDYNLANSLYKEKKYKEAIDKYKNIKTEDRNLNFKKLHNLGNSYVQSKQLEKAKESYTNALKIKNDKETSENLDLVKKELKKRKESKDSGNKDKKEDKKEDKKSKKKKENQKNKKSKDSKEKNESKKKEPKDKKSEGKESKDKKENTKKSKQQSANQNKISNKEEKKWLDQLKHQKTNSLLKEMKSSKQEDLDNPW